MITNFNLLRKPSRPSKILSAFSPRRKALSMEKPEQRHRTAEMFPAGSSVFFSQGADRGNGAYLRKQCRLRSGNDKPFETGHAFSFQNISPLHARTESAASRMPFSSARRDEMILKVEQGDLLVVASSSLYIIQVPSELSYMTAAPFRLPKYCDQSVSMISTAGASFSRNRAGVKTQAGPRIVCRVCSCGQAGDHRCRADCADCPKPAHHRIPCHFSGPDDRISHINNHYTKTVMQSMR
mgnify:CR=1 FL=1